ncbi:hypothetical protein PMAYCL1PPCAC_00166, partial [Pristionchus mayeri]
LLEVPDHPPERVPAPLAVEADGVVEGFGRGLDLLRLPLQSDRAQTHFLPREHAEVRGRDGRESRGAVDDAPRERPPIGSGCGDVEQQRAPLLPCKCCPAAPPWSSDPPARVP